MSARIAFLVGISFVVWALATLKLDSRQDEFERNMSVIEASIERIDANLSAIRENLGVIEGSTAAADATYLGGEILGSDASTDAMSAEAILDCMTDDECWARLRKERGQ